MREIKFRGKGFNGNWYYGYLVIDQDKKPYIVCNYRKSYTWDEVIPETVGQFIGMKDKNYSPQFPNGHDIYENDIVSWKNIKFETSGITRVKYGSPIPRFEVQENDVWYQINPHETIFKVIGNIHDNPELISKPEQVTI